MDAHDSARQWARTWERSWPAKDVDAIAALYADGATYRSNALDDPVVGGARSYVTRQFPLERGVTCRFADPITDGARSAVPWWASWEEDGATITLAGTTVLHFDDAGLVIDHVDYWVHRPGRIDPYPDWLD